MANNTSGGIGCGTALFLIFLVLKLVGVITWSWWWVTAPLWIPLVVILVILFVAFLFQNRN
jgi:phosphoglycerol transferase MdoB-like AlkP superfamily enzyme